MSLQPPLWPAINDHDEWGAQLAGISFNFAHLAASNPLLAHKIYSNQFQWACERGGKVWGESGKENRWMDVQAWDMQCQVLSCPPSLLSSGRCSQTTAPKFEQHYPAFTKQREQDKSHQSTNLSVQTSSFGSTLNWQHVQPTQPCHQPTGESWQIPTHRLQSLWLLIPDTGTLFEVVQRTWRSI